VTPEEIIAHIEHTDMLLDRVKLESAGIVLILERLITAVEALAAHVAAQQTDGK
jgi:hypothetical protein